MSERLGRRCRRRGLNAGQLRLEATYADYTSVARTVPLGAAVLDMELGDAARTAFSLANTKRLAVRSVSLTLDRLMEMEAQLELWASKTVSGEAGKPQHTNEESSAALQHALDHIRTRYGSRAVHGGPLTSHFLPLTSHHSTTIFPKVALPSRTRCASAS